MSTRTSSIAATIFFIASTIAWSHTWTRSQDKILLQAVYDACRHGDTGFLPHGKHPVPREWFDWQVGRLGHLDEALSGVSAGQCYRRYLALRSRFKIVAREAWEQGLEDIEDFRFLDVVHERERQARAAPQPSQKRSFFEQCADNIRLIDDTRKAGVKKRKKKRSAEAPALGNNCTADASAANVFPLLVARGSTF